MSNFHIDDDRANRLGFPEIIYGASKSVEVLTDILQYYEEHGERAFVTKLQEHKAAALLEIYPGAFYDALSGVFVINRNTENLHEGPLRWSQPAPPISLWSTKHTIRWNTWVTGLPVFKILE